jgi:hypothetical protein
MVMPFGRYRGRDLEQLPEGYIDWLLTISLRPYLRLALEAERRRRLGRWASPPPPRGAPRRRVVEELVGAGRRSLTRKYHPDVGGGHEQMVELNHAAVWLLEQARGLLC